MKVPWLVAYPLGFAAVAMALFAPPSYGEIRIDGDMGGDLGAYMRSLMVIRDSGEKVVIDGDCFSACTLVTAFLPRKQICVTRRARLGFHSAQTDQFGRSVISPDVNRILMELYPPPIQSWLTRNGGLGSRVLILQGRELHSLYPLCG